MPNGEQAPLHAVVLGATGVTGRCVVVELLKAKASRGARRRRGYSLLMHVHHVYTLFACGCTQRSVGRVTLLTRRKLTLPESFGVDLAAEEGGGRLVQHVEGELARVEES